MRARARVAGLAAVLGALNLAVSSEAVAQTRLAATPSALDSNTLQPAIGAPSPEAGPPAFVPETPDQVRPRMAVPGTREPRGNPLWGISLKSLSVTRERPLFLPSRRPPAPAVAGPPAAEPMRTAPPPEPDHPRLALVGAIAGEHEGIGIFIDERTRDIVRLKTGDNHLGWVLSSVKGREATLRKDRETILLSLPAPADAAAAPPMPGMPGMPPTTGSRPNTNYGGVRDEDL
jgi:general secretion pathway protein N